MMEITKDGVTCSVMDCDGDFRSDECKDIMNGCDVVVTNPPFSMFREFVTMVMDKGKEILVLGTAKGVVCKEIFPFYKNSKLWLGKTIHSGDREFRVPDDYPILTNNYREDENGVKYIRVDNVRWITNMKYEGECPKVSLSETTYDEAKHPKYDNFDAIHVKETKNIPNNYYGVIGVPVTYIDKHNPELFDIVGIFNRFSSSDFEKGLICGDEKEYVDNHGKILKTRGPILNKKALYTRLLIKRK